MMSLKAGLIEGYRDERRGVQQQRVGAASVRRRVCEKGKLVINGLDVSGTKEKTHAGCVG
jgi:hypothetical protein